MKAPIVATVASALMLALSPIAFAVTDSDDIYSRVMTEPLSENGALTIQRTFTDEEFERAMTFYYQFFGVSFHQFTRVKATYVPDSTPSHWQQEVAADLLTENFADIW